MKIVIKMHNESVYFKETFFLQFFVSSKEWLLNRNDYFLEMCGFFKRNIDLNDMVLYIWISTSQNDWTRFHIFPIRKWKKNAIKIAMWHFKKTKKNCKYVSSILIASVLFDWSEECRKCSKVTTSLCCKTDIN